MGRGTFYASGRSPHSYHYPSLQESFGSGFEKFFCYNCVTERVKRKDTLERVELIESVCQKYRKQHKFDKYI